MRTLRDDQEPVDARRPRYRIGEARGAAASTRARLYTNSLEPILKAIVDQTGWSATEIAGEMTCRGLSKPRGSRIWTSADAHKLLRRLDQASGRREVKPNS
jgi:hypothetical protein